MKFTVCESINPPVKELLQRYFVLWYCPVDSSSEWGQYAAGLGSFTLPLISVISTADSENYLDRTTAVQSPNSFYVRLKAHIGDIDHSTSITLADAILSLTVVVGTDLQSAIYQDGDINGDKKIGLPEAVYLLRELAQ